MQARSDAPDEQEELKRQIAALQARLLPSPKRAGAQPAEEPTGPTRRVLVARSPSPKRRKLQHDPKPQVKQNNKAVSVGSKHIAAPAFKPPSPPRKSTMAAAASAFQTNRAARLKEEKEPTIRSTSFAQPLPVERSEPTRNDDMTVKEDLPLGPIDHPAPFDDPRWERREPYSGIHLSSRKLPFDEFQEFMYGRVYLSPSKLYSVVRLSPDRSGYDVPVEGDWVTIAVIAERGQVQVSKRGNRGGPQGKKGDKSTGGPGQSAQEDDEDSRPAAREKKYMRLLLVDFGHRASEGQPTPKEQTKGDALLNMLLFEADSAKTEDGQSTRSKGKGVTYKGGSGGAFEACAKLREGAVLAILNPRILKPFQRNSGNPHPRDNALAITPENAESIAVLGYSRDLGSCRATKRDGNPCGSWCDKRISEVCEYHIQDAIKSKRAARPEFSAGTADFSSSSLRGGKGGKFGKPAYDPSRKWGLAPSIGQQNAAASSESAKLGGGATYIVDGRVFSGLDSGGFDSDTTRLKRLKKKKEEELALEEVIRKDGGKTPAAQILKKGAAHLKSLKSTSASTSKEDSPDEQLDTVDEAPKKVYSADLVKSIGFDPSRRSANNGRPKEGEGMRQLVANLDRSIDLGPARGTKRLRSNVTSHFAPPREKEEKKPETKDPEPGSDSDSELEIEF
ncbi:unnamed protein product [Rhizoctonia solani]|uniref:Zinc finger Mcm10/DnaG-type domain-containing protein n=1 Tax=Rhizoctonia solani TaxID=456999 RepID=A0A8H3HQ28_9AGAM|nr:unnamed protein product [Rhizoctonia solani]